MSVIWTGLSVPGVLPKSVSESSESMAKAAMAQSGWFGSARVPFGPALSGRRQGWCLSKSCH
eukprot:4127672-Lingulodinium_polyedra.AAC.1